MSTEADGLREVSREWAETFLREWSQPYFGPDRRDAVACVQRAANLTLAAHPPEASEAERERREGAVEALREAADAFGHMWQSDPLPSASIVYRALRDRAARIARTTP